MIILVPETWPQEAHKGDQEAWQQLVGRRLHRSRPAHRQEAPEDRTAKTRAEARQLEARLIREAGTGQHRAAGNKTVAELLDAWREWRPRKGEIADRTMLGYASLIEHKIIPALGELRLSRVDTATIDRFLAQLSERGTRCKHCQHLVRLGQTPLRAGDRYRPRPGLREREHPIDCLRGLPMTPSAVRDVHAVLAGAFKQAQVWGWIDHDPMALVTRPAVKRPDVRPPQVAQAEQLIDTAMAKDPELGLFLVLAVVLGARRGEVCRLRWSHIDLDRGEVLVGGKITSLPGKLRDEEWTKTRSKRRVAIAGRRWWRCCAPAGWSRPSRRLPAGSVSPDAYVFSHEADGSRPIRPDGVTQRFTALARRLGVQCRLHDLRHFLVTQLIASRGGRADCLGSSRAPRWRPHDPGDLRALPGCPGPDRR
jgi:integrase